MSAAERSTERVYVISIAAELTGMHPQTLRTYDRLGLVSPRRTDGRDRRYQEEDLEMLKHIRELVNAGVNLAGIERILRLEKRVRELQEELNSFTSPNTSPHRASPRRKKDGTR